VPTLSTKQREGATTAALAASLPPPPPMPLPAKPGHGYVQVGLADRAHAVKRATTSKRQKDALTASASSRTSSAAAASCSDSGTSVGPSAASFGDCVLMWFRNDLRLVDNPALIAAADSGYTVIPVFVWSPEEEGRWGIRGARFAIDMPCSVLVIDL
jgi:hypothetical protein